MAAVARNGMLLFFCAFACRWGPVSARVRRSAAAGAVVGATLDRVGEMEKMNLTCFNTTDPQFEKVNHIYDDDDDKGFLWRGQPADMLPCYNTSTPAQKRCVPCLPGRNNTAVRALVCKDIPATIRLVMEADDEPLDINITPGDCPSFAKPADPDAALDRPMLPAGKETDGQFPSVPRSVSTDGQFPWWWGWLCVPLCVIVAVSLGVLGYWKRDIFRTKYPFVRTKLCSHVSQE